MSAIAPLSELHRNLETIKRHTDATRINAILNHEAVKPFVQGMVEGDLDISPQVADRNNVLLMGEHGGIFFHQHLPGLFEAHTSVLPEGRGPWTLNMVQAALHWMFTRTGAVEIVTRCPKGNVPAKALAKAIGGRYLLTRRDGWAMNREAVPAEIYSLMLTEWMNAAPGLTERGHWFHVKLEADFERLGKEEPQHADDLTHDRFVGAACEMILADQVDKGVIFYNRFACVAGYAPITVEAMTPLTLNIRNALVIVRDDGDFYVASILDQ